MVKVLSFVDMLWSFAIPVYHVLEDFHFLLALFPLPRLAFPCSLRSVLGKLKVEAWSALVPSAQLTPFCFSHVRMVY